MAITLNEAKIGMADKVDQQIVDMFRRSSFLLDNMVFDNVISPGTGGSTLTYGYIQLKTPSTAGVRTVGAEYTPGEAKREQKTTDAIIMGGAFQVDRVLQNTAGAADELAFQAGEKIKATKDLTKKMIDGLKTNGYYQFENGNVISDYVYTKLVDAKSLIGYRLTAQASEAQMANPEIKAIVYPSWRGQHDDWASVCAAGGFEFAGAKNNTNLAIQGLFEQVDGAALEAAGYTKVEWGKALVANEEDYYNKYFNGYDYETAPVYVWPFTPNIISTGGFRNGYGFQN